MTLWSPFVVYCAELKENQNRSFREQACEFRNTSIGSHRDVTIKWAGLAITPYPYGPYLPALQPPKLTATTTPQYHC